MRLLLQIQKENNLKILLKNPDEDCDIEILNKVFDEIIREYWELKGVTDKYLQSLDNADADLYEAHKINACEAAIRCLLIGRKDLAEQLISALKLKLNGMPISLDNAKEAVKSLEALSSGIQNGIMFQKINEDKRKKKNESVTWDDLRVYIQQTISILPDDNCTVSLYVVYEKRADDFINAKKKANGNKA